MLKKSVHDARNSIWAGGDERMREGRNWVLSYEVDLVWTGRICGRWRGMDRYQVHGPSLLELDGLGQHWRLELLLTARAKRTLNVSDRH